ncbi:MAG: hypothetical protein ONB23_11625 [candidate division KSB1 bacterium]|nr:hypothetical protein [candidate division KSB1 bacterium]
MIRVRLGPIGILVALGLGQHFGGCAPRGNGAAGHPVVFLSNRDAPQHRFNIFLMDPDGRNLRNLSAGWGTVTTLSRPRLSPDGREVLFVAFHQGGRKTLSLAEVASGKVTELTELDYDDPQASFDPKGQWIVYLRKFEGKRQVWLIGKDGRRERCLSQAERDEYDPAFSWDGQQLVFVSAKDEQYVLVVHDLRSGRRREIMPSRNPLRSPSFSPSGRAIVFCVVSGQASHIYTVRVDGGGLRPLVRNGAFNQEPRFLPDGRRIVFVSNLRGAKYCDVCVVDRNGSLRNLTLGLDYINQFPVSSPDGRWIYFHSARFGDCDIYRVRPDGGAPVNLTRHPAWDQMPHVPGS